MSFEEFWKIYPLKREKLYAHKCYDSAIKDGATHEDILSGAKNYAAHVKNECIEQRFIKHASSWLNKGCWLDEYEAPVQISCSPEESRHKARIASYNATGRWLDE